MSLTAREKDLVRAAGRGTEAFEEEYSNLFPDADGATIAGKFSYYSNLDEDGDYDPKKQSKSSGGGIGGDSPTTLAGWVQKGLGTQFKENEGMAAHEFQDLNSILGIAFDQEGKFRGPLGMLKTMATEIGEGIVLNFAQQNDLLMKMNENTGMLGLLSKSFREEITEAYPEAIKLGISFESLTDAVVNLVAGSGKFKLLSRDTIEEMALASKFAEDIGEYAELAKAFEDVSLGIYDMTQLTNKAGMDALEVGLNSRATVKGIGDELYLLNQYGFEDGVEGLSRMVQKSIEFRMNMDMVTGIAEKVWDPEGALEMVSNLQVLGGAIGDLNDPIRLMYMATNDVEGLQDALIGATQHLVTYNNEQGRFEVTGANLRRAKEMADQFGMSMGELTTTAVAAMERTQAASDLMSQGLVMDEQDREFLTNLSQMKEGRMVIEVPQSLQEALGEETEIAMESMTQQQAELLLSQRDAFKDMSMKEIAMDQVSLIENINRDVSFITASMRIQAGKVGDALVNAIGFDPAATAVEAAALADKIGGKMDVDLVFDAINSEFGTNIQASARGRVENTRGEEIPVDLTKPTTTTESEANEKVMHYKSTIELKSGGPLTDNLAREWMKNPMMVKPVQGSYLEMFSIK